MEAVEMRDKLKEIASCENMTAEQKEFVRQCAKELGVEFNPKSRCKSCYFDAIIICLNELKKSKSPQVQNGDGEGNERQYILREGVDVIFGVHDKVRVNENTLTDELAEIIIKRGFPKSYFRKCK